jgi:hypothetical protein
MESVLDKYTDETSENEKVVDDHARRSRTRTIGVIEPTRSWRMRAIAVIRPRSRRASTGTFSQPLVFISATAGPRTRAAAVIRAARRYERMVSVIRPGRRTTSVSRSAPILGPRRRAAARGCAAVIVVAAKLQSVRRRTSKKISMVNQRSERSTYLIAHTSCGGVKSLRESVDAHGRHDVTGEVGYAHAARNH